MSTTAVEPTGETLWPPIDKKDQRFKQECAHYIHFSASLKPAYLVHAAKICRLGVQELFNYYSLQDFAWSHCNRRSVVAWHGRKPCQDRKGFLMIHVLNRKQFIEDNGHADLLVHTAESLIKLQNGNWGGGWIHYILKFQQDNFQPAALTSAIISLKSNHS